MVDSYPEKTDIKVRVTFTITGTSTKLDPDSQEAYIEIKDIEGDVVLTRVLMTPDDVGIYSYWWETSAVGSGVFTIIVDGEFSTHTYVVKTSVELE